LRDLRAITRSGRQFAPGQDVGQADCDLVEGNPGNVAEHAVARDLGD
jgi:hypothetical protein